MWPKENMLFHRKFLLMYHFTIYYMLIAQFILSTLLNSALFAVITSRCKETIPKKKIATNPTIPLLLVRDITAQKQFKS
jgi:hypothetical protein